MNDTLQVYFFGGNQRETLLQIETHLITKATEGTCTGSIALVDACIQYMLK